MLFLFNICIYIYICTVEHIVYYIKTKLSLHNNLKVFWSKLEQTVIKKKQKVLKKRLFYLLRVVVFLYGSFLPLYGISFCLVLYRIANFVQKLDLTMIKQGLLLVSF